MKLRLLPLFILILVLVFCGGCKWSPDLLSGRISQAQNAATTVPYYVQDMQGNTIRNYQVNKAAYNADLFLKTGNGRMVYNDSSVVAYSGIDVSSYQEEIDWQAVKNDGITFAFIRVGYRGYGSEGKICEDEMFKRNIQRALNAGLRVGVYFFSQAISVEEALEEAEFTLSLIQGYPLAYPVVFDWERYSIEESRTYNTESEVITACAKAFCDRIMQAGYRPMIYLNCDLGYYDYDLETLSDYDCWLAQYNDKPTYYYHYTIWQYTKSGTVAGINGTVDMNISLYDYASESLG
ncbi:MAG: glycoside hydrolase family 25 protein [Clostridia bacterium]|nr:glycoside hydrolase family 25 protein [Clostridia bacterium]